MLSRLSRCLRPIYPSVCFELLGLVRSFTFAFPEYRLQTGRQLSTSPFRLGPPVDTVVSSVVLSPPGSFFANARLTFHLAIGVW